VITIPAIAALLAIAPLAVGATQTATTATAAPGMDALAAPFDEDEEADLDREEPPTFIEAIEIIGNTKTERSVIVRRLSVAVGDLVDDDKIDQSRLRLQSTGFFRSVEFGLRRGSRRGRVVLVIEVVERNTITIDGLHLGRSQVTPFFAGLVLEERNFLGRGMSVRAGATAGRERRGLRLDVLVPELSDTPLGLSASLVLAQAAEPLAAEDPTALELRYSRAGGSLGLNFGIGPTQRVSLDYRLESILADRLPNLDPAILRAAPSIQFDESILSTLSLRYERDTRDDPFVPTQGGKIALAVEVGSKILASSYEFSKYTADLQLAFTMFGDHAARLRLFGGLIQGQAPFFNQFFVRDFAFFDFGGDALARVLGINYSAFTDYDDLILSGGLDYNVPFFRSKAETLQRAYLFAAVDVSATASLDELQEDVGGRGPRGRVPISFDLGVKLDTFIGHFKLSAIYVLDLVW
jgi:outer membrane protein assembly factor BamA